MAPTEYLEKLLATFPDFREEWDESLFREDDGALTFCGMFSTFSWYARDHFMEFSEEKRREMFGFVESCIKSENENYNDLDTAVCTCFLENLAGEPPLSTHMRLHMGENSRLYFDHWDYGRSLPVED